MHAFPPPAAVSAMAGGSTRGVLGRWLGVGYVNFSSSVLRFGADVEVKAVSVTVAVCGASGHASSNSTCVRAERAAGRTPTRPAGGPFRLR